jgi:copper oxidase (laccase) domain-containing protein
LQAGAANAAFFKSGADQDHFQFDLPGYCLKRLQEAGLAGCESLGLCTYENESLFFSYRRSSHRNEGDYGRQISAMLIL